MLVLPPATGYPEHSAWQPNPHPGPPARKPHLEHACVRHQAWKCAGSPSGSMAEQLERCLTGANPYLFDLAQPAGPMF